MAVQDIYDNLWSKAGAAYDQNQVEIDPHLHHFDTDDRNGLSLVIRLSAALYPEIQTVLSALKQHAPNQYIYIPQDLHVTFLTLVPVVNKKTFSRELFERYDNALREIFEKFPVFDIHFQGITASPGVVMLQGYPHDPLKPLPDKITEFARPGALQGYPDDALNILREHARDALNHAGLGDNIDVRYKITAAHVTLMRFASQPSDFPAFVEFVKHLRAENRDFGVMTVEEIALTENDYYMSSAKTTTRTVFDLLNAGIFE